MNVAANIAASQLDAANLRRLADAHGAGGLRAELRDLCTEHGFAAMARAAEGELARRARCEA